MSLQLWHGGGPEINFFFTYGKYLSGSIFATSAFIGVTTITVWAGYGYVYTINTRARTEISAVFANPASIMVITKGTIGRTRLT